MTGEIRVPPADAEPGGGVGIDESGIGAAGPSAGRHRDTAQLDALQAQVAERTADLQRISAEYSNYRRRVERDRQLVAALAKAQVAGELLTVLDDIERAQQHGDLSGPFKAVADKLVAGLTAHGLEPFGAVGDGFDPGVHEAVHHDTAPDVHGPTVTAVLRRGYRLGERVLRPAMVAVTDAEPSDAADPSGVMSRDAASSEGTQPRGDTGPGGGPEPGGDAESFGDPERSGDTGKLQDN
ncbi:MAG TPA: nucleotide exchange factor GrpE [Pseudonocardiaceae bacterium]|nr:nucleotide exchange factor GrpE [Pseudonocardiaceae bacterium]